MEFIDYLFPDSFLNFLTVNSHGKNFGHSFYFVLRAELSKPTLVSDLLEMIKNILTRSIGDKPIRTEQYDFKK